MIHIGAEDIIRTYLLRGGQHAELMSYYRRIRVVLDITWTDGMKNGDI